MVGLTWEQFFSYKPNYHFSFTCRERMKRGGLLGTNHRGMSSCLGVGIVIRGSRVCLHSILSAVRRARRTRGNSLRLLYSLPSSPSVFMHNSDAVVPAHSYVYLYRRYKPRGTWLLSCLEANTRVCIDYAHPAWVSCSRCTQGTQWFIIVIITIIITYCNKDMQDREDCEANVQTGHEEYIVIIF